MFPMLQRPRSASEAVWNVIPWKVLCPPHFRMPTQAISFLTNAMVLSYLFNTELQLHFLSNNCSTSFQVSCFIITEVCLPLTCKNLWFWILGLALTDPFFKSCFSFATLSMPAIVYLLHLFLLWIINKTRTDTLKRNMENKKTSEPLVPSFMCHKLSVFHFMRKR